MVGCPCQGDRHHHGIALPSTPGPTYFRKLFIMLCICTVKQTCWRGRYGMPACQRESCTEPQHGVMSLRTNCACLHLPGICVYTLHELGGCVMVDVWGRSFACMLFVPSLCWCSTSDKRLRLSMIRCMNMQQPHVYMSSAYYLARHVASKHNCSQLSLSNI